MQDATPKNDFLIKLTAAIKRHISDENFGVSELAAEVGMSRSNLLRKVKKLTELSASQYIRQVRLQEGMALLLKNSLNVSEVSYQVGFGSTSYFIKCFREHYGYPPGEAMKRYTLEGEAAVVQVKPRRIRKFGYVSAVLIVLLLATAIYFFINPNNSEPQHLEKSIVVLPFKNDSNDSTNVYLINGLMESTLNNLQKIRDLRVLSRTSAEKYRNTTKTIPEMAKELKVSYFVEGSGQKIGNRILLNIQLIEASTDKHLWAQQYERQVEDIFELQQEIAKNIASEIQAVITQAERKLIEKIPTQNMEAYDQYLQGLDFLAKGDNENMSNAIPHFKTAIALDKDFALAHANLAITYFYLDIFQEHKQYTTELNSHSDRALLLDPKLPESLLSKAFYYLHTKDYNEAVPYLEKAHEYHPNSAMVINFLSDFYARYMPNTEKYLEYALKGVKVDIASKDSVTTSYTYLHLSNALIQSGFVDEALKYIDLSLVYFKENPFSNLIRAYILYAKNFDLDETRLLLLRELEKDTTRLDIIQEIGKIYFYQKDYEAAYQYYQKLIYARETLHLDMYRHENLRMGAVLARIGQQEKANEYFEDFRAFAETNESMYQPLLMAGYYMEIGDEDQAIAYLRLFDTQENVQYWIVLFLSQDPLMHSEKYAEECTALEKFITDQFWENHEMVKRKLKSEGLL